MIDLFSSPENATEKNERDGQDQNFAIFAKQSKADDNASNENSTSVSYGDSDLPSAAKQQDSTSINNSYYDYELDEYDKQLQAILEAQALEMEENYGYDNIVDLTVNEDEDLFKNDLLRSDYGFRPFDL